MVTDYIKILINNNFSYPKYLNMTHILRIKNTLKMSSCLCCKNNMIRLQIRAIYIAFKNFGSL